MGSCFDSTDFFDHVRELRSSGRQDPTSEGVRLELAGMAVDVIENEGGVVPSKELFSYAMTGLPTSLFARPPEPHDKFIGGLWALRRQFTQATADVPFLPPRTNGADDHYFLPRGYSARAPYWVAIRGLEPYEHMPNGWGLGPADSSVEYKVTRSSLGGEVVGRVVVRGCFYVSMHTILEEHPDRPSQIPVIRKDVTLYEARRELQQLPSELPRVKPARFALATLRTKGVERYMAAGDRRLYERALVKAMCAAQHRADYRGSEVEL